MDREHYRKFTPSRVYKDSDTYERDLSQEVTSVKKHGKFCEKLVSQFIVCGVILMAILVLNLFDTPLARDVGRSILSAVRGQTTIEDVRDTWTKAKNSVNGIFERSLVNGESKSAGMNVTDAAPVTRQSAVADEQIAASNFRIDEDILSRLQADAYSKDENSKDVNLK